MKKRLLVAYDCMMVGGTTTALLNLLNALDYSRYEVDVILYRDTGALLDRIPPQVNHLPPAIQPSRIPDAVRKLWRSVWNGQVFRAVRYMIQYRHDPAKNARMTLWQATEQAHASISRRLPQRYDVAIGFIESWGAHYVVSDRVDADKRLVWIHPDIDKSYLIPELNRTMFRQADAIVTVSEECRAHLVAKLPEDGHKVNYIENILDVAAVRRQGAAAVDFRPTAQGIRVVSMCRIAYHSKGLDRGLSAMQRLKAQGLLKNICWYWIGDGPDLPLARQFVKANGLEQQVVFLGQQLEPLPLVKQADVFFLPSRYEGKPMAVTEAQMLGLPCVVTAYAAAAEQINSGVDGLILDNTDEAIYEFMKRLCAGEYPVERWRQAVAEKEFSAAAILQKVEELWNGYKR